MNLGARMAAWSGDATVPVELYADVSSAYGWNNLTISVALASGSDSGTATYPDGTVHTFTSDATSFTKSITTGRIVFSDDFDRISFGGDNNSRSVIGFVSKNSKMSYTPNLCGTFYMTTLVLEGPISIVSGRGFRDCGTRSESSGFTIDLTKTNVSSLDGLGVFASTNANKIVLPSVSMLSFQCFAYAVYLSDVYIYASAAPNLVNGQYFRGSGTGAKKVHVPIGATGYDSASWVNALNGGDPEGSGWTVVYDLDASAANGGGIS